MADQRRLELENGIIIGEVVSVQYVPYVLIAVAVAVI